MADLRVALKRLTAPLGFRLVRVADDIYDQDGLRSWERLTTGKPV